ncbi:MULTISPECIES: IucA/IucC family protein [Kitasatospora]|uniref:Putative siderophore biosynthesis protein n=1 Tax=Kitasatospora setae (strain ATCC 33774 / DSM 43861 / JCM 3304 / KCC A-0304 / NBRC 14216 / KM-6054) TaxID=452652 RepID=E4N7C1_KITSK|nr:MULTISPECIES: IucA/IucC family protein [Kitasatospora]BAJ27102.1 putative siderophore biosynthesis protein [Kitasatospora setae KM-6054]
MTTQTDPRPAAAPMTAPDALPAADDAVAHTLLNCLLREVSGPEHQTAAADGTLLLRLPRRGALLRVALRRTSLLGGHRFTGPVSEQVGDGWRELGWRELAEHVRAELTLRTGVANEEFLDQVASSHRGVAAALAGRPPAGADRYLDSEQALLFGHRFHPAPKSRSAPRGSWSDYAPEARAAFRLRHLAVRTGLIAQDSADPAAPARLDALRPVPDGYTLLPVHPWQYRLLSDQPLLAAALARGDVLDLGEGGTPFAATASVRTLYGEDVFLKFSLNVRITNCLRKNSAYELAGAVTLTRLLAEPLADLAERFPDAAVLREPAFRTLALPGPDGEPDLGLYEGFGLIVREGLAGVVRPGLTPLLAGAVADEYPTSGAQVGALTAGSGAAGARAWWGAYLRLVVPPVLAAYFDHGVVLEPHLQNVLVCVDGRGMPAQVLFRDLEGTKLLPEQHAARLAALPAGTAGPMTYDARRGWDRVVYCLVVNHLAELLAALADRHPELEAALWADVRTVLAEYAAAHGCPPRLAALLAGVPLPAKANLLTRWSRRPDREAGYVPLASPLSIPARAAGPKECA